MNPEASSTKPRPPRVNRRIGYAVLILLFGLIWWMLGQLHSWGWIPFLTEDFNLVVPWMRLAIAVSIGLNLVFVLYDPKWLTLLGEAVVSVINVGVGIKMYQVFPFDVSRDWARIGRVVILLGIVGTGIAIIGSLVKAIRSAATIEGREWR